MTGARRLAFRSVAERAAAPSDNEAGRRMFELFSMQALSAFLQVIMIAAPSLDRLCRAFDPLRGAEDDLGRRLGDGGGPAGGSPCRPSASGVIGFAS
jgi:hypothetical protein